MSDGTCARCGTEFERENWGTTLFDDFVGLPQSSGRVPDPIELCEDCRDDFIEWLGYDAE